MATQNGTPEWVPESAIPSTYTNLNVHFVFAAKGRRPLIDPAWEGDLHAYIGGIARHLGGVAFAVGGTADHVHMVAGLRAVHAPAEFVREVKKASSPWGAERCKGFSWQEGYGAFSVDADRVRAVVDYIARQADHHKQVSSADELRVLLAEHGISFDERCFE